MINKLNSIFVTFFGIGKIKKIPGTFASLATTLLLFFLFHILNVSPNIILFAVIIIFLISLYAVNIFIKDLSNKDPKEVVIDEVIGQSIPLYLYEVSHNIPKDFIVECNTADEILKAVGHYLDEAENPGASQIDKSLEDLWPFHSIFKMGACHISPAYVRNYYRKIALDPASQPMQKAVPEGVVAEEGRL